MTKNNISAKDLAFEKERVHFRKEINFYKNKINQKDELISDKNNLILQLEDKIKSQDEWIERLISYCNENNVQIKEKDDDKKEIVKDFIDILKIFKQI